MIIYDTFTTVCWVLCLLPLKDAAARVARELQVNEHQSEMHTPYDILPKGCVYDVYPTNITCTKTGLCRIPKLPQNTLSVTFKQDAFTFLPNEAFAHMPHLETLALRNCKISILYENSFKGIPNLKRLSLFGNKIVDFPQNVFKPLPNLRELDLSTNRGLFYKDNYKALRPLMKLSKLVLKQMDLNSSSNINLLGKYLKSRELQTLDLGANPRITTMPDFLWQYPLLSTLTISGNRITTLMATQPLKYKHNNGVNNTAVTMEIDLASNQIKEVKENDLYFYQNISKLRLNIKSNKIELFERGIACDNFLSLDISGTKLGKHGMQGFLNVTENLQKSENLSSLWLIGAGLQNNASSAVSLRRLLEPLKNNRFLRLLSLSKNKIAALEDGAFVHVRHVMNLIISDIGLRDLPNTAFSELPYLSNLEMNDADFTRFVIKDVIANCPKLKILHGSSVFKGKTSITGTIADHDHLRELHLPSNQIQGLTIRNMSSLTKVVLKSAFLQKSGKMFNFVMLNISGVPKLKTLILRQNRAHLQPTSTWENTNIFAHTTSLELLDLANNKLAHYTDSFVGLFRPLVRLITLVLDGNDFLQLPETVFEGLSELQTLFLRDNRIAHLPRNLFKPLSALKKIYLSYNQLTVVYDYNILPLVSLSNADFSYNPLPCICENRWFINWLKTTNVSVYINPTLSTAKCFSPPEKKSTKFIEYDPLWIECDNHAVILSTSCGSTFFAIILFLFTIYYLRWDIRYFIAIKKARLNMRNGYVQINENNGNVPEFDAFLSYNTENLKWVRDNLEKPLEHGDDIQFRLCIRHRNYEIGAMIVDNINANIEKSKRVIFVVTKQFLSSEWCAYELNMSHVQLFQEKRDMIIIVLAEKLMTKEIPKTMRALMRHVHCLKWSESTRGKRLFLKKLKLLLMKA